MLAFSTSFNYCIQNSISLIFVNFRALWHLPASILNLISVERVYDALLNSITEGTLAPGIRLAQEDLAEQLNVSRQPVLQALRLLKKDGFVVDAGKRGVMVTSIDAEAIAQVYQLRGALDALASRLAAERQANIDPGFIERGRKAARGRSIAALVEADIAFPQRDLCRQR